jgi:hypothetical protein
VHFVWMYMRCCEFLPMAVLADPRPTQRRATHGRAGQSTSGQPGAGHIRAVQGRRTGSAGPIRATCLEGGAQHIRAARGSAGTNLAAGLARGSARQAGQRKAQQLAQYSMSEHSRTNFEQSRPKQAEQTNPAGACCCMLHAGPA